MCIRDRRECRDKNHLALHSITVEVQLVFANVIPRQETDAAGYDQQHDRDICLLYTSRCV